MIRVFFIALIAGLIAVAGLAALPAHAQDGPSCAQVADVRGGSRSGWRTSRLTG